MSFFINTSQAKIEIYLTDGFSLAWTNWL